MNQAQIAVHLQTAADILVEMSVEIEALGEGLCVDPSVLSRHIEALQGIDLMAQKQRWLASLLRAECNDSEVDRITVDSLRARFAPPH